LVLVLSKIHVNKIKEEYLIIMGIRSAREYVNFFKELEMGNSVSLINFINNEKNVLKHKLQTKEIKNEIILEGIKILEQLSLEIKENGEKFVLEKYKK